MQKYIFPFLVFIIGFYLIGIRLVGFDMDGVPGDMGDGRLNNYFLEHGYQYLIGKVNSYWDAPFFYPEKATMSMSDNLFGTLPLYALFRLMSFDRETAYQIWFLCIIALNYITCFFCLKKLKISPAASAIGAFIFAFALPVAAGIGHIQMLPKFAFPIIIYCLIRFMQDKRPKYLFFFFLFTVYQMYCGIYLGFMSIIASLIIFFIIVFSGGFKTEIKDLGNYLKRSWVSTTLFFLLNLVLVFILLRPYIARSGSVERDYGDIGEGLPTPISYLYPGSNSLLYDWMRPLGKYLTNPHEHTLWMGLSCILAVVLGVFLVRTKKNKQVKFWLLSFLLIILITLNFYGHVSFYAVVYLIPGFEAVRAVSRIVQIELFFLGGLIAVVIDQLVKEDWKLSKRIFALGLVTLFVIADQFVWDSGLNRHSKKNSQFRLNALKEQILFEDYRSADAFVYIPSDHFEVYKYHMDAMLVSQEIGLPTVNGYSAFSPESFEPFFEHPNNENFMKTQNKSVAPSIIIVIRDVEVSLPPQ